MDEQVEYDEPRGKPRGRPRGRQRGRGRAGGRILRNKRKSECDEDEEKNEVEKEDFSSPKFDEDCDISALEAPKFTTLDRGPPAPMLKLSWNHPVSLIGEKVISPRIHICDTCDKPILIYGRMIPCKHIFCLTCAKSDDRVCPRCGERVARVEQTGLGTVFMCTHSINDELCKRTYLSQRDLQAHVDHRHVKSPIPVSKEEPKEGPISHRDPRAEARLAAELKPPALAIPAQVNDPRISAQKETTYEITPQMRRFAPTLPPPPPQSHSSGLSSTPLNAAVMTSASRNNGMVLPIQDQPDSFTNHSSSNFTHLSHISHAQFQGRGTIPPPPFASPPHSANFSPSVSSSFAYSNTPTNVIQPNAPHFAQQPTRIASSFAGNRNPVPVPPPTTFSGSFPPSHQWHNPPPLPTRPLGPSGRPPIPPNAQNAAYYR